MSTTGIGIVSATHDDDPAVLFNDQTRPIIQNTSAVSVAEASLPDGGWVVIHNLDNNANIIGVSQFLGSGHYRNLLVEVDPPGKGTFDLLAMLHRDDPADKQFTFPDDTDGDGSTDDPPYMENGNIVQDPAKVTFN